MKHVHALEHLALTAQVHEADRTIAFVDGVVNLLSKAQRAIDEGTPAGRDKALALIDRAERFMPDEAELSPDAREGVVLARESIRAVRASLGAAGR
jgi:hypothetical protein